MSRRTIFLTLVTLVAFASNSIFCRLALAKHEIDAASFTSVRLASGAIVMGLLAFRSLRASAWKIVPETIGSALALFVYAVPFSFAYLALGAGVGALILFGCVQLTMIGFGVMRGERPPALVWLGLAIAGAGLVILTKPGASAPDPFGALLMAVAGVCWGIYSLRGKTSKAKPLPTTAAAFILCLPAAIVLQLVAPAAHASTRGIVLAVLSGAVSSGIGYTIWYAALEGLSATRAAIVQLAVPILAAIGGILFLGEALTTRHVLATFAVLGGVALAITRRTK